MRPLTGALISLGLFMSGSAHAADVQAICHSVCEVAAVQSYIDALLSHNAQNVPLADNAQRVENGKITGTSGDDIRQGLENDLRFRVIFAIRDEQIIVEGDEVVVIYSLDTGKIGNTGKQLATGRVFERFRVVNGLISEIEAEFRTLPGHAPPPVWPDQQN
jgi:hypothetical protein